MADTEKLLLLMSVLAQTLFTFVRCHLMSLSLFSARHSDWILLNYFFIVPMNTLAGLKAGMSCAGIVIVVFLVIFLAAFSALCLMMKLPKPRRYTGSFLEREALTLSMKASTTVDTVVFSSPVDFATSFTISALVIITYILIIYYIFFNTEMQN